jgi:hypothetical protein
MTASRTPGRENRPAKKAPPESRASKSSAAVRRALRGESVSHDPLLSFGRTNYLLMAGGAVLALIGFLLLRGGDISLAPFLLVMGYCALIPLGIVWRERQPGPNGGGGATRAGE